MHLFKEMEAFGELECGFQGVEGVNVDVFGESVEN